MYLKCGSPAGSILKTDDFIAAKSRIIKADRNFRINIGAFPAEILSAGAVTAAVKALTSGIETCEMTSETSARTGMPAAEHIAENITEDVIHIAIAFKMICAVAALTVGTKAAAALKSLEAVKNRRRNRPERCPSNAAWPN